MPSNEQGSELTKSDEVSKNASSDSGVPQGVQGSNLVFDFLYHDARRIASFLAQFETYGVLQQVRTTETAARLGTTKAGASAGLDVPLLAKGGLSVDGTVTDEERDAAERSYDPLWTNARTLLNYLADREMIVRDLRRAGIGQFVLVAGNLAAFDLGLFKEAWKLPAVKEVVLRGIQSAEQSANAPNRHERRKQATGKSQSSRHSESEMGFEMLKIMPHTIQATIRQDDWTVWSSLRDDSLVVPASELLLKHGVGIAGEWHMLGILDAQPDEPDDLSQTYVLDQLLAAMSLGGMAGQIVGQLGPAVRLMLGRPSNAFGMTPLLIFRDVSPQ